MASDELRKTLRELAEKATPGEWWIDSHGVTMMALDTLEVVFKTPCVPETAVRHPETGNLSNWRNDWDASYIATANPANILSLLEDFDAMRQRAEKAEALLQELRMQHGPHDQTQKSGG